MATRAQIVADIDGVIAKLSRAKKIFLAVQVAGDEVRYVDDNPDLPYTITNAMKQQYAQTFDTLIDEGQATTVSWG